jgi:hypothetical protein
MLHISKYTSIYIKNQGIMWEGFFSEYGWNEVSVCECNDCDACAYYFSDREYNPNWDYYKPN